MIPMYVHSEPMELTKDSLDFGDAFCPREFRDRLRRKLSSPVLGQAECIG
jgi:hypothetical protein